MHQDQPDTNNKSANVDDKDDVDNDPAVVEQNNKRRIKDKQDKAVIEADTARDAADARAEARDIDMTVFPPTRTRSACRQPSRCRHGNFVMAQVIENAPINNMVHKVDNELVTQDENKMAIWGFLMT